MKRQRLNAENRVQGILTSALALATEVGYRVLTREKIADAAGVTGPLINHYWGNMDEFKKALLDYAVEQRCLPVVAQAIVAREPLLRADASLRADALSLFS